MSKPETVKLTVASFSERQRALSPMIQHDRGSLYLILVRRDDEVPTLRTQVPRAEVLEHGGNLAALLDIFENSIARWTRWRPGHRNLCRENPWYSNSKPTPTVMHRHRHQEPQMCGGTSIVGSTKHRTGSLRVLTEVCTETDIK